MKYFGVSLLFPTIPKPLKQHTLFKKDYSFRSYLSSEIASSHLFGLEDNIHIHK